MNRARLHLFSLRGLLFVLFVATITFTAVETPLNAGSCTGTNPPCVLTQGFAGPTSDARFNARQNINPYETTFTATTLPGTSGTLFEVDDSSSALPTGATSNPIMAQPLYVAGLNIGGTSYNAVVAVTLNTTIYAWDEGGTLLWKRAGTGGTAGTNALYYNDCGNNPAPGPGIDTLQFEGILSTPVIDASGTNPVMFLTSQCQTSAGGIQWWLHVIDLTTGLDLATNGKKRVHSDFSSITEAWQNQRAALLQVKSTSNSSTPNLVYLLFGTMTKEVLASKDYAGWVVAYCNGITGAQCGSTTGLTPEFAYSNQPGGTGGSSGCGSSGGLKDNGNTNGQCPSTANSGSPSCDCFVALQCPVSGDTCNYSTSYCTMNTTTQCTPQYPNAPNWGGHGGGCWQSGNGPAATAQGAINDSTGHSDGNVHTFFGCGNGGFQTFNGTTPSSSNNNGQTVMDFRLTGSGFDSTKAFQTFTPNSPAAGVAPPQTNVCGCNSSGGGCGTCTLTYQNLNISDQDVGVGGVALLNDRSGNPRLVHIDKAGYGYLQTQGQLCGTGFTTDTGCVGYQSGDPGSWTFGASKSLCGAGSPACDRVAGMAVYDNQGSNSTACGQSGGRCVFLIYWPFNERLTEVRLSDNSATVSGTGSLTWTSGTSSTLTLSASCTPNQNCLGDQIVVGDTLALSGSSCACVGGTCPTVISVVDGDGSASYLTINTTINAAYSSSCTSGQTFTYTGWFVTPAHDSTPTVDTGGFAGGSMTISANCSSPPCTSPLIWPILPGDDSIQAGMDRGVGYLYAYSGLPNSSDQLAQKFASTDTWCASSFARPTVVNAKVFAPTYAVSCPSGKGGCGRTQTFSNCKSSGTGSIGDGNGPYPSGLLRYQ